MSIIFQTIRKLQQEQTIQGRERRPRKRLRKPGAMTRLRNTPFAMGLTLVAIFLGGFALLHWMNGIAARQIDVHEIASGTPSENNKADAVNKPNQSAEKAEPSHPQKTTVPQPYSPQKAEETPAAAPEQLESPPGWSASYSEHEQMSVPAAVPTNPPNIVDRQAGSSIDAADYSNPAVVDTRGAYDPELNQAVSAKVDPKTEQTKVSIPGAESSKRFDTDSKTINPPSNQAKPAKQNVPVMQLPDDKERDRMAGLEKFRRAAKQRAQTAQIVARLERAIAHMDASQVKKLMDQLGAKKGRDDLYVLNLKAYWYMKLGKYTEAEPLLKRILAADEDHLEAGVNMAILEFNTQRREAALKRLKRLSGLYPENTVIADMIRKLL